jgi:hypothetical protein
MTSISSNSALHNYKIHHLYKFWFRGATLHPTSCRNKKQSRFSKVTSSDYNYSRNLVEGARHGLLLRCRREVARAPTTRRKAMAGALATGGSQVAPTEVKGSGVSSHRAPTPGLWLRPLRWMRAARAPAARVEGRELQPPHARTDSWWRVATEIGRIWTGAVGRGDYGCRGRDNGGRP